MSDPTPSNKIPIKSHRDLIVWQKAMNLVTAVYLATEKFPRTELYGLTSQIRRAARSVPANIAEGRAVDSAGNFCNSSEMLGAGYWS